MRAHVALLRGINVGGKNGLPMKTLAAMFADAGCADVQTYIQSGNVVYRASDKAASRVAKVVERAIAEELGLDVPVTTRTALELGEVARANPFPRGRGCDPSSLHVVFLASTPTPAKLATLDPKRSPPDELAARGREIYLRCPNGIGRSKLTNAYFDRTLGTVSTVRNWRTVLQLLAMVTARGS